MTTKKLALLNLFFPQVISSLVLDYTVLLRLVLRKQGCFRAILWIGEHETECPLISLLGKQFVMVQLTDLQALAADIPVCNCETARPRKLKPPFIDASILERSRNFFSNLLCLTGFKREYVVHQAWKFNDDITCAYVVRPQKPNETGSDTLHKLRWLVLRDVKNHVTLQRIRLKTEWTSHPDLSAARHGNLFYLLVHHSGYKCSAGILRVFKIAQ